MNSIDQSADLPETGPKLEQVDPPHPFKSAIKTFVIAAVALVLILAIYVYSIQRPPLAAGQVTQVNLYPVHSEENGGSGDAGMQGSAESYDQLLVLAKIKVRNQTNIPLFMQDISASVTLPDGSQQENIAAGSADFDRVFQAYPSLSSFRSDPIRRDATLEPGQSIEGLAIFNFPLTPDQWRSLHAAKVVVSFIHQKNLLLDIPR